jgi:rhamnosyltransferase
VREPGDVTVIVRARDEAENIGRCLSLVDSQVLPGRSVEVVVVDSGSRDETVAIARRYGARVIELPPAAFTFGGALNLGAANAGGALLVALSAHAFPPDQQWLARLIEPFSDPQVACACGADHGPDDAPLVGRITQDAGLAGRRPEWGYSNGAGAFRAELWRRRPFRDDLPACEDKEWAWHWLGQGYVCVVDAALSVEHDHTHDSLPDIYRRGKREAVGIGAFLKRPTYGPRELIHEWWFERGWHRTRLRARLSARRAARLLGVYAGRRRCANH